MTGPFDKEIEAQDARLSAAAREAIALARRYADEEIAPRAVEWERTRTAPEAQLRQAIARHFGRLRLPAEHGGLGLDTRAVCRVMEELAAADLSFAFSLWVHINMTRMVALVGRPAQRDRYLDEMCAGQRIAAFCLTEPDAGSDAAALRTHARKVDGGWRIDGAKAWVTGGVYTDLLAVWAQADPAQGHRGIGCWLIEADRPGVVREPADFLLGGHAMGVNTIRMEAVEIPDDNVLLPPGEGFRGALAGIDIARVALGAMNCGMLRTGIETALAYVSSRSAFGEALAAQPVVRATLADAAAGLAAARALVFQAADLLDKGRSAVRAAAQAKKFATQVSYDGLTKAMQVMGAAGLRAEYPLARHLAGAKASQYMDGASEIQDVVIARDLFRPFEDGDAT